MEYTIDAKGKVVGRLASEIARLLMNKHQPSYRSNAMPAVTVKVYNTDFIKISGQKPKTKTYYRHSGYIGNLKAETFENLLKRDSRQIIKHAVNGMLPKNRLRKHRLHNMHLYKNLPPEK